MQTYIQTFNYPAAYSDTKSPQWLFNRDGVVELCFNIIEFCGDCWIGIMVGAVIGWISGWSIALVYRNSCQPGDFISFDIIETWRCLPYEYAQHGLIIGAAVGVFIILIMTLMKMTRKMEQETDQNAVKEDDAS